MRRLLPELRQMRERILIAVFLIAKFSLLMKNSTNIGPDMIMREVFVCSDRYMI